MNFNVKNRDRWLGVALLLLALAAFANSFSAQLLVDSAAVVRDNPRMRFTAWEDIKLLLTDNYWAPNLDSDLFRPLTTLSFWANFHAFGNGPSPLGYHVVNLFLHMGNVLLLWRIALRLGATAPVAWLAAALFAVHPIGVEAVTNIVGRSDLFVSGSALMAVLAWLRAEATTGRSAWLWRLLMGAVGVLGCFAKESGILAVAAVGLVAVLQYGWRGGIEAFWRRGLPWLAATLLTTAALRYYVNTHFTPVTQIFVNNPIADAGVIEGLMTAIKVIGRCLQLYVWPARLAVDYSYPQIPLYGVGGWEDFETWLALFGLIGIAVLAWRGRARWPLVAFGLGWAFVMYFPTSNILVRIGAIMGERFLYLPMVGLSLVAATMLVAVCAWVRARTNLWVAAALPAACLVALAARTLVRNTDWYGERSLWESSHRAAPRSFNNLKGLAGSYMIGSPTEADTDRAIHYGEMGLALLLSPPLPIERQDETLFTDMGSHYRMKGDFCRKRGDETAARQWFEKSLAVLNQAHAKDAWVAIDTRRRFLARGDTRNAGRYWGHIMVHFSRGVTLIRLGRMVEGLQSIAHWRRIQPLDTDALLLLGRIDRELGEHQVAATRFLGAIILHPKHPEAWKELLTSYEQMKLRPAPAEMREGGGHLDVSNPAVRVQLNTAFLDIVRTLRDANWQEEAALWQERAIKEYSCPPEIFVQ